MTIACSNGPSLSLILGNTPSSGALSTDLQPSQVLMFMSINEELGRHRGQSDRQSVYTLCGAECESVVHVLWECPACKDSRDISMIELRDLLGENFKSMGIVERSSRL